MRIGDQEEEEFEKYEFIEIVWRDSMVLDHGEWMDLESVDEAMTDEALIHRTVGFFLKEADHCISIAHSRNDQPGQNDRVAGVVVIPIGCIISFRSFGPGCV